MSNPNETAEKLSTRILRHLASREAWNLDLLLIAFGIYSATSVAFDALRTGTFDSTWLPIWVVTFVVAVIAAWIVVLILPRGLWKHEAGGFAVNVAIAMYVGAVKNTVTFGWSSAAGLDTDSWDPFIRVFGGALMGLSIFVLAGSLTASRVGHKQEMLLLVQRQGQLNKLRGDVTLVASKTQADLVRQAKNSLLPQIENLKNGLGNRIGAQELVVSLQTLVEKYVRPLSKSLSLDAERLAAEPVVEMGKVNGWQLPKRLDIAKSIFPIAVYLVIAPSQYLLLQVMQLNIDVLQLLLGCTLTLLTLFVLREVWPKRARFGWFGGGVAVLVISLLAGIPEIQYLDGFVPKGYANKTMALVALLAIVFVSNAAFMTTVIMDQSRLRVRSELREVNSRIDRELAIFDQRVWLQKRRWSYLLHGKVAAKLTAASLKAQADSSQMVLSEVSDVLDEIVELIADANQDEIELRVELDNLVTTWRGLLEIKLDIDGRAWRIFDTDQNAAMAINEICREATNNAVRHGDASELRIKISNPTDGELLLTVANNGIFPRVKAKGLGLQMMDALTSNWGFSREQETGFVAMTAVVPYSLS